jgi:hypothetical protein
MIIEILGGVARILLEVIPELIGLLDFPGRSKYRDYLDSSPTGSTPLSKREWKSAGKPERHTVAVAKGRATKTQKAP